LRIFRPVQNLVIWCLSLLPDSFLQLLTKIFLKSQGKGWGSKTIRAEVKAVLGSLKHRTSSDPISVFDIGANIGDWSAELLLAHPNARIHAFEPSSSAFSYLSNRFADDSRVKTYNFALGDFNGVGSLFFDSPSSGFASLTNRRLEHFGLNMSASESIEVRTLNSFKLENLAPCDILKIDIEGNELKALQSGLEVLKDCKVVLFEFGGANLDSKTSFQDFWYFFKELNFKLSRVTPAGLREIKQYSELDEIYVTTNFLAIRQ
jgi:FkbM family methyltransferase